MNLTTSTMLSQRGCVILVLALLHACIVTVYLSSRWNTHTHAVCGDVCGEVVKFFPRSEKIEGVKCAYLYRISHCGVAMAKCPEVEVETFTREKRWLHLKTMLDWCGVDALQYASMELYNALNASAHKMPYPGEIAECQCEVEPEARSVPANCVLVGIGCFWLVILLVMCLMILSVEYFSARVVIAVCRFDATHMKDARIGNRVTVAGYFATLHACQSSCYFEEWKVKQEEDSPQQLLFDLKVHEKLKCLCKEALTPDRITVNASMTRDMILASVQKLRHIHSYGSIARAFHFVFVLIISMFISRLSAFMLLSLLE